VRWFVVLLLLANIILFFWVQQQSKPAPGSVELPPPEIGRLRLLGEGAVAEADADVAAAPASPDTLPVTQSDEPAMPGAAEAAAQAGDPNSGTTDEAPDLAQAGAENRLPEPVAELPSGAVPVATADATAEQTETPPVAAPPAEVPAGPVDEATDAGTAPLCLRVGPLAPGDADAVVAKLPRGLQLISDTSEEYAQVDGYFVLIPALPSVADAQQVLGDLAAAGIKDTWLFRGGELRNAISLGVYSNRGGAQRHADLVAKKGFATAEVREKTSPAERRWLQLKGPAGAIQAPGLSLPQGASATPQVCP